jgi:hypothetical protein
MPSRPRLLLLIPAAAAALALAGCSLGDDGPRTTQTRDVGAFTRVDNRASADVRLHVGQPQSVRVHAGRKVIGGVHTDVRDGTLVVSFNHHGWGPWEPVVVDVGLPKLSGVVATGSGDVDADGISAGAFDVRSDGSSDITLDGTAQTLTLDLNGSGDADLTGLTAHDGRVSVDGSGDADVRVERALDATVDGSGSLRYHGNPSVTRHHDGSGDLTREP